MDALTAEHRAKQLLVRRQVITHTRAVMPLLQWADLDGSFARLEQSLRPVIAKDLATSAGLAATYVRKMRAKHGPAGRVDVALASLNPEQFATSLRVTTVIAAKSAAGRGLAADLAMQRVSVLASNAMTRIALDGGRRTVVDALKQDRGARYQRVLGGSGCDFCQMLAGRGAVYSAETADFEAHDKCACMPEPAWA